MKRVYLDNNATTFLDPAVLEVFIEHVKKPLGNPSSIHYFGQEAKSSLLEAREEVAKFLKVRASEITFTSGATEAINTAIKGYCWDLPPAHIISSNVEHAAVNDCLKALEKKGWKVTYLPAGIEGCVKPEDLQAAITDQTKLIALMAVNNETGVKNDFHAFAQIAQQNQIPFFLDAVALVGKESFTIPDGVSALCFSGHKLHAPKGVGVLFARPEFRFRSLVTGGGQEYGKRGGTENILGIIALSQAVHVLQKEQDNYADKMRSLRDLFEKEILSRLKGVHINGKAERICNTSNLSFEGVEGESLLMNLDLNGIAASHGSACSAGALEPSHVLINMGIARDLAQGAVRFGFCRFNTEEEVHYAVEVIACVVSRLRALVKS